MIKILEECLFEVLNARYFMKNDNQQNSAQKFFSRAFNEKQRDCYQSALFERTPDYHSDFLSCFFESGRSSHQNLSKILLNFKMIERSTRSFFLSILK